MERLVFTFFIFFCVVCGQAQPGARLTFGPCLQAVGEHEFCVVFGTDQDAVTWVEVAPDDFTSFYAEGRPRYYQVVQGRRPFGKLHCIRVDGLEKGTTYRYRLYMKTVLKDEGNKRMVFGETFATPLHQFRKYKVTTLDSRKPEIRFSMFNDIHGRDSVLRQLAAPLEEQPVDFVILNGDMTSQIESEEELRAGYLDAISECFAYHTPVFASRGNHDLRGSYSYHFLDYFPNFTPHTYYTFRHGPAYFILLDSGEDKPDSNAHYYGLADFDRFREEEVLWLKQVVRSEAFLSAPVRIVIMHMPPDCEDDHGSREVGRLFMPVLNAAGIDVMLCGHLHYSKVIPKGEKGNRFPILINSNHDRMDVVVGTQEILVNGIPLSLYR